MNDNDQSKQITLQESVEQTKLLAEGGKRLRIW